MERYTLIIIAVTFIASVTSAQPPVEFIRIFDAGRQDVFTDIYHVADGGFAMCGRISDGLYSYYREDNSLVWVVRADEEGGEIWSQTYGPAYGASGFSIIETDEGNFLVGGRFDDFFWAMLIDQNGEEIWSNTYGIRRKGYCHAVIELKSGEFVLTGRHRWPGVGYIVCVDGDGEVLWDEEFDEGVWSRFYGMRETQGGIVLTGNNSHTRGANSDAWIMKINLAGEQLWSRSYNIYNDRCGHQHCFDIVVAEDNGFAISGAIYDPERQGGDGHNDFLLIKVNNIGEIEWFERYDLSENHFPDYSYGIVRTDDGGYILAGLSNRRASTNAVLRVSADGVERWRSRYNLGDDHVLPQEFYSVVRCEDNSIIAAGTTNFRRGNDFTQDGLLLKLEPEFLEPIIFFWSPEDTNLTVLSGDTVHFSVQARDQQGDELSYLWIMGEDTLSTDDSTTVIFNELGNFEVQCQVSDNEFTSAITWHINVVEWFISGFTPDSLDMTIRRGTEVDFTLEIAAIENIELNYLWTLTDRNRRREEVGETDSITMNFDLAGDFQLESLVWRGEESDGVVWDVLVRSAVWYWWPREDSLTVSVDSTILFAITPFNPDSDSLEYLWTLDGDSIDFEQEIEIHFEEMSLHEVVAFVNDGCEADTISWDINVIHPDAVPEVSDGAMPTEPVLYPPAPNPFNMTTTISYFLPTQGSVSLRIYDTSGRLAAILSESRYPAGKHNSEFHAEGLSTGIYFISLQFNGLTLRALLVK